MRNRVLGTGLVMAALVATAGCQRLNFSHTYKLGPVDTKEVIFTAPAYAQKVLVTITPTNAGVSAYLVKKADAEPVTRALELDKEPAASLLLGSRVSKGVPETYSFEATVPAKTEYVVLLKSGAKSTDVKLAVVGR